MKRILLLLALLLVITATSLNAREVSLEAKITGLYVAFFNRAGDQGGLTYWTQRGEEAQSSGGDVSAVLKELSAGFATHPTFVSTYGSLSDQEFVEAIYRNALGRDGDAEGIGYWTNLLNHGTSRSDMVATFVEASLVGDLTSQNYPNLTFSELAAAQLRQDLITNKVTVALAFTHQLGVLSNVVDNQNPQSDRAYLASIKIISRVTEDPDSADAVLAFLVSILYSSDPIADILEIRYEGSGTLPSAGGSVFARDVIVAIPSGGALRDINVSVEEVPLTSDLPAGFRMLDKAFDIDISHDDQDKINAPLKVTVVYDDSNVSDENDILVLHYNTQTHTYEPVTIIAQNTIANTLVFESRSFSPFVLVVLDVILPVSYDTGYRASSNGWNIANFGSYFSPGGNCFGMSGYTTWYHNNRMDNLRSKFTPEIAKLVATRAHLAQNQAWGIEEWRNQQELSAPYIGRLMKAYMSLLNRPLILLVGIDGNVRHAMVVYKYDAAGFYFYDVNYVDSEHTVTYNGTTFGVYGEYNTFGYAALASLGRTEDFAQLTSEAEAGFVSSQDITLTSPEEDEEIADHSTYLTGSLSGSLNSEMKLYATVKGVGREVPVSSSHFNQQIEISHGENTIVLLAGVDMANQSNWAKNGATLIRTVQGTLEASRMIVTLTWDQAGTDLDLYITDPAGETMYYSNKQTTSGVTLDFDDTNGYGPEHGTLTEGASVGDTALEGNYIIRVHYFSDHETGTIPASGRVNIVLNAGEVNQVEKTIPFSIYLDNSSNHYPDDTGADWADIAVADIIHSTIH